MKTAIIANPRAGAGKVQRKWDTYQRSIYSVFGAAEASMTARAGHATEIARRLIGEGIERIVVVGGDGTLNEVVNGLFSTGDPPEQLSSSVELALYPVGTGGDFSRSIGISKGRVREALEACSPRRVDLGRARLTVEGGAEVVKHFINISSFGSSGLVVDRVNRTTKAFGGKTSFMIGTVRAMLAYRNQRVRLRVDDSFEKDVLINTVAVANGRYFGGSMKIAPDARLDDGELDVVVVGDIGLLDFARAAPALYKGTHVELPDVEVVRGRVVTATPLGKSDVLIDLDGEQPGHLPVRYEILPKAVTLLAPWDRAEAV